MALSLGVSVGSKIDVGGHMLQVKALVHPNMAVVTVDGGEEIVIRDSETVEILPGVTVQTGFRGDRLAFHAAKSIRIFRVEETVEAKERR